MHIILAKSVCNSCIAVLASSVPSRPALFHFIHMECSLAARAHPSHSSLSYPPPAPLFVSAEHGRGLLPTSGALALPGCAFHPQRNSRRTRRPHGLCAPVSPAPASPAAAAPPAPAQPSGGGGGGGGGERVASRPRGRGHRAASPGVGTCGRWGVTRMRDERCLLLLW